jgi:STE24 endopeptidase
VASPDGWLAWSLERLDDWQALVALIVVAAYVVLAFGFLSRRCEREADLFGCRAVSCGRADCQGHDAEADLESRSLALPCSTGIDHFIAALERVAVANGVSRSKPGWLSSWQHATIEARVAFLERVRADPGLDRRYRWRLSWVKWALLAAMAAAVGGFIAMGDLPAPWP